MWQRLFRSVCPVCDRSVEGIFYEEDDRVLMRKTCPEHGEIVDLASSNAVVFKEKLDLSPEDYSDNCTLEKCGVGVFACREHFARKAPIAFIEVTPRCNMNCPICYIDASTAGDDIPLDDIERMIAEIKEHDPDTHLVLIGGEPTIHRDFFQILAAAGNAGLIRRCYLATNGLTLVDEEFARRVKEMGLRWLYLGFDSTDREICKQIRGSYRAHEAAKKTIENLRKLRRRVVLSVTVVRGINDEDLVNTFDFAVENSDVIKRISISAEVFCGRQTTTEDLLKSRVTVECLDTILTQGLKVGVATMPLSMLATFIEPFKVMGVIPEDTWIISVPHPLCGSVGLLRKNPDGTWSSVIDRVIRNAPEHMYKYGKKVVDLLARMKKRRERIEQKSGGKILWRLIGLFWYLPRYLVMVFSFIRPAFLGELISALVRSIFTKAKLKDLLFGSKRVEFHYLISCDKYNFVWEKMPYCITHHYRIDPETKRITKMCGCYVLPFRSYAESCNTMG